MFSNFVGTFYELFLTTACNKRFVSILIELNSTVLFYQARSIISQSNASCLMCHWYMVNIPTVRTKLSGNSFIVKFFARVCVPEICYPQIYGWDRGSQYSDKHDWILTVIQLYSCQNSVHMQQVVFIRRTKTTKNHGRIVVTKSRRAYLREPLAAKITNFKVLETMNAKGQFLLTLWSGGESDTTF